ncbi:hypothetical protein GIB67_031794 [Kingdonia uniflora]|uniref:PARG helical domain-containing protein n=1 Tax=Kingdonia uniflora TaxID=39325 RepID=A0A7J7L4G2_9MAGN|nr:hypothetical protein GIB67_031794 [Kingdonia uniflora]
MENKLKDYNSILPFLPLILESTTLIWPPQVIEALKSLSRGPNHSKVDSGEILFLAITDLRDSLHLSKEKLSVSAADGYSLFFDELMSHVESEKWFREVVPALASLLLRLPDLLEDHYRCTNEVVGRVETGLRLLGSQEAGIVLLSQGEDENKIEIVECYGKLSKCQPWTILQWGDAVLFGNHF